MSHSPNKNIEVELRGSLDDINYGRLQKFLKKEGTFITTQNRLFIDYSSSIQHRDKDIRLRITDGIPEIMIKVGHWGGVDERKELSVKTKPGDFPTLIEIFGVLGYTNGILINTKKEVYRYKGAEIALVTIGNKIRIFEAELLVSKIEETKKTEAALRYILSELNLTPFTDQEFYQHVEKVNNTVAELFEFKRYNREEFIKKYL